MVGVPRSRGCARCREQKKKCIVISEPPCSRCKRLDISCIGYGERRLKFQDESQRFVLQLSKNLAPVSSTRSSDSPQSLENLQEEYDAEWATMIAPNPTNLLSVLTASFTSNIDGRYTDTGHDLAWNFGIFLHDVPRYLGLNQSLDAAADALVAGYDHFRRNTGRCTTASAICLRKYSQALKSLRTCLSTVEDACEPTTLCAIQIVMTVETLMGISNVSPLQHAGGAAGILKCRGTRPPRDKMERTILLTLRGPVVIQAFFLDETFYSADEWTNITSGFSEGVDEGGFFPGLAATARLFQSTRRVLSQDTISQQEKTRLLSCASTLQKTVIERVSDLLKRLDKARDNWALDMRTMETKFDHGFCTRDYGLALSTQIQVNCILSALHGEWSESTKRENTRLCQEICKLGENEATHHRPLGSAWILIALSVAYIGADSVQDKTRVVKLWADYTYDFPRERAEVQTIEMERLAKYLSCGDLTREFGT